MFTESSEIPSWGKSLFEGLVKMNASLVDTVKGLQDRQNKIEARLDGKPQREAPKSEEPTPEEVKQVVEKLFI